MITEPILVGGSWIASHGTETFHAVNPATMQPLDPAYPISPWADVDAVLAAAAAASEQVRNWPGARFADFLERFASRIEAKTAQLVETANLESGLPAEPRLKDVELPRTVNQLKQAAAAARDGSWATATIDRKSGIRSMFGPIGPVAVFGPNNFPFAFSGCAGGDFAAAVAAGNPVIAKAHSSHPGTAKLFAIEAHEAASETKMPSGFFQMIYRTSHADGMKLAADPRLAAIGYTGGRHAGLQLKAAADAHGKPFYAELSSINPVVFLPNVLAEKPVELAQEFSASCLMGVGQFCTNPGLVLMVASDAEETFMKTATEKFAGSPVGTMLSEGVQKNFGAGISTLVKSGAQLLTGGQPGGGKGYSFQNTLLRVAGEAFLVASESLQTEAFGNGSLVVVCENDAELLAVLAKLEGNLTGSIYSAASGADDDFYLQVATRLRAKVGRLLNDKMPTGVAVVSSMNHGGPFPATGHPGFTAVGIPAAIHRFAALHCYDNVRPHRLPAALQDKNPTGQQWRLVDGSWSQGDVI